jgi:hypothetical protein
MVKVAAEQIAQRVFAMLKEDLAVRVIVAIQISPPMVMAATAASAAPGGLSWWSHQNLCCSRRTRWF